MPCHRGFFCDLLLVATSWQFKFGVQVEAVMQPMWHDLLSLPQAPRQRRWLSSIFYLLSSIFYLLSSIFYLLSSISSPISHLPSPISHLPSSIFHLPSPISHLPSPISHLPSSIFHLPSSIFHLPSSIFHLPSSIFHFLLSELRHSSQPRIHAIFAPVLSAFASHPRHRQR